LKLSSWVIKILYHIDFHSFVKVFRILVFSSNYIRLDQTRIRGKPIKT
jgi:hypothetical protein